MSRAKEDPGAALVRAELAAIEKRRGELTPAAVIEAARPADSPLHRHFTWDDASAAAAHRVAQARALIRRFRVRVERQAPRVVRAKARVERAVAPKAVRMIRPVAAAPTAAGEPGHVERAWDELLAWRARYEGLREFVDVIVAIDRARLRAAGGHSPAVERVTPTRPAAPIVYERIGA